jgi:basic membrane lipoprotein Med (substrate-binding protein (PBP1-ABC) superfamily)
MNKFTTVSLVLLVLLAGIAFAGGSSEESDEFSVGVFVPGVVAGSPTYEAMVAGVQRAVDEGGGTVLVVEGGFNQGQWKDLVTEMAADGSYDVIITSNPAMPAIAAEVAESFPNQRFAILDGYLEGNPAIYAVKYNQWAQGFLIGHLAGLLTVGDMEGTNPDLRIGLLAGQDYPDMTLSILPGFQAGADRAAPGTTVDFRVLGNWYDAARASEMASAMMDAGADVILTIAGGGNQGVIDAIRARGGYVLWFDVDGYDAAPGIIAGSTEIAQERAAYELTRGAREGSIRYGSTDLVGVPGGWVRFVEENPLYLETVPAQIRAAQRAMIEAVEAGDIVMEAPLF